MIDALWKAAREAGALVRVDTLGPGDQFTDISGKRWAYTRRNGANAGAYHVVSPEGVESCFAGCAEVLVIGGRVKREEGQA